MSDNSNKESELWERTALRDVMFSGIKEHRTARRWNIFFKFIFISYLIYVTYMVFFSQTEYKSGFTNGSHVATISIDGTIAADSYASAENIIYSLEQAYKSKGVKGIILKINSPGGSPVQARMIYNSINMQKEANREIKIYAAIEEIGTSAAYLIASAADEIYADETSLVGSIGALISSFGFVEGMNKLGIERRLYTAGNNKGMLDPFSNVQDEDADFIRSQIANVHQHFIKNVTDGRGDKLKITDDLFSGKFWTGDYALKLGLIDGFADYNKISLDIIQEKNIVDYTVKKNLFDKLSGKFKSEVNSLFDKIFFH